MGSTVIDIDDDCCFVTQYSPRSLLNIVQCVSWVMHISDPTSYNFMKSVEWICRDARFELEEGD